MVRACSYLQTIFEVFWASCRWTKFCKKVQVRQPQVPSTLRFLPHTKPLSFSFLEVYFLAYLSTLTEHVLHPVLSLVIYSSSWEKKNIQRWSYIIYIMFNVFILLKILLVSRFSPLDPASCVLVFNSGYPNTNFSFCLKVRKFNCPNIFSLALFKRMQ